MDKNHYITVFKLSYSPNFSYILVSIPIGIDCENSCLLFRESNSFFSSHSNSHRLIPNSVRRIIIQIWFSRDDVDSRLKIRVHRKDLNNPTSENLMLFVAASNHYMNTLFLFIIYHDLVTILIQKAELLQIFSLANPGWIDLPIFLPYIWTFYNILCLKSNSESSTSKKSA